MLNGADKEKLLECLRSTPIVQIAVRKAGISRATFYRWKKEDPVFSKQVDVALGDGREVINDVAESVILKFIRENNLGAAKYWLEKNNDRYKKSEYSGRDHSPPKESLEEEMKRAFSDDEGKIIVTQQTVDEVEAKGRDYWNDHESI